MCQLYNRLFFGRSSAGALSAGRLFRCRFPPATHTEQFQLGVDLPLLSYGEIGSTRVETHDDRGRSMFMVRMFFIVTAAAILPWSGAHAQEVEGSAGVPCNLLCGTWLDWGGAPAEPAPAAPAPPRPESLDRAGGVAPERRAGPRQASGAMVRVRRGYAGLHGPRTPAPSNRSTRAFQAAAVTPDGLKRRRITSVSGLRGTPAAPALVRAVVRSSAVPETSRVAPALSAAPRPPLAPAATSRPAADVPVAPLE